MHKSAAVKVKERKESEDWRFTCYDWISQPNVQQSKYRPVATAPVNDLLK